MPRLPCHCTRLGAALALLATAAAADTVLLRNGDRISGQVLKKAGTTLTLKTDYANELKLDRRQVQSVVERAGPWAQGDGFDLDPGPGLHVVARSRKWRQRC